MSGSTIPHEQYKARRLPRQGFSRRRRGGSSSKAIPSKYIVLRPLPEKLLQQRLDELHDAAAESGIAWLPASETGLRQFLATEAVSTMPMLTLRPGGQLRALWEDGSGAQIGIQFDDEAMIDYVIFSPLNDGGVGRHYGMADHPSARSLITALELRRLLA